METYYKARKNIGNALAQQSFVNMNKMSTIRRRTKDKTKTLLDSFREMSGKNTDKKALEMVLIINTF